MKLSKSLFLALVAFTVFSVNGFASNSELIKEGEKIFNTKDLGNCLACHAVNEKEVNGPGTMGPKLQYLSAWPEDALYQKIYNPYTTNPISAMPAFGKNGWLSHEQIQALVAYLKTIN
ncbi:sulfur oxidation c-type cytochrome SoxX [Malaciobacter marinus]|uniref:Sulfur oxidation c-type cytochrome SoxX n=1 Tax=Malaciobacter marinus TaxID=505249 RepID=A0A347TIM4_9BACT|nr:MULTISPECIES: sulfur oxidation c-type cytochrome SoxX [Malaciobacter]AXX86452.1 sulfur oxidation protein SoxXA, monoheme cytochrome c subunit [Malaciobacter marinus]PHO11596.1 sulfur oxidation c-type cytochrome SoxX [Malaciobacter marinus]PHO15460.1 sulfur oxidation c-type cytochrome SoxX [Malaciobacter marinus]RYA23416.1 sulfur oxidation c-type cytochrome SoxX [Malaciobacter halophilus]